MLFLSIRGNWLSLFPFCASPFVVTDCPYLHFLSLHSRQLTSLISIQLLFVRGNWLCLSPFCFSLFVVADVAYRHFASPFVITDFAYHQSVSIQSWRLTSLISILLLSFRGNWLCLSPFCFSPFVVTDFVYLHVASLIRGNWLCLSPCCISPFVVTDSACLRVVVLRSW